MHSENKRIQIFINDWKKTFFNFILWQSSWRKQIFFGKHMLLRNFVIVFDRLITDRGVFGGWL